MKRPLRIAFIGNALPRRCGIATFTTDLQQAVAGLGAEIETSIVAMNDHGQRYAYTDVVACEIDDVDPKSYENAADFLNAGRFDAVCLQHEFGIFGGDSGSFILPLLSRLTMPIVTTLHTVLEKPNVSQQEVLAKVISASARVIVMAEKASELLQSVYAAPAEKIELIPHGIPDVPFGEPGAAKAKHGYGGKSVILTFGLLSHNKGIEFMIDAMPFIVERCPNAVYIVLGATHPNVVRDEGEGYRHGLQSRAFELGMIDHIVFLDQFVDKETLIDFIAMCDVYVTPYLNEAQMTSGTLAYSFGAGKAVVSTPYWHARELLADDRGILVPFGDTNTLGGAVARLLTDDPFRDAMRERAYAIGRGMTWSETARRYCGVFDHVRRASRLKIIQRQDKIVPASGSHPPLGLQLAHFHAMCDDTGLFQHAIHSVPDRSHGYCVDDNARALLLACALNAPGEHSLSEPMTSRFASFIQHAWNADRKRFRNFLSFERTWLEEFGSEDSHARTVWALGEAACSDANPSRRSWARVLFCEALPTAIGFRSPRSWCFTLLGLNAYLRAAPDNAEAAQAREVLARRLVTIFSMVETGDWVWFEEGLAYDNARFPQALIETGVATSNAEYLAIGLKSLRWLVSVQTSPDGNFRPVGTRSFRNRRKTPELFDQQPLEATATISACLAAWRAEGNSKWKDEATRAFAWFIGSNDLSVPLVDVETGSCRDGLHADRANENRGGESVVSYLLSLCELRQVAILNDTLPKIAPLRVSQA